MKCIVTLLAVAVASGRGLNEVRLDVASAVDAGLTNKPKSLETLSIKFLIKNFNYYDLTKESCPESLNKQQKSPKEADNKGAKKKVVKKKVAKKDGKGDDGDFDVNVEFPKIQLPKVPGPEAAKVPDIGAGGMPWPVGTPPAPRPVPGAGKDVAPHGDAPAVNEVHKNADKIAQHVQDGFKSMGNGQKQPGLPWMKKKGGASSLLQMGDVAECSVRQDLGHTSSKKCTTIEKVLRTTIQETVAGIIRCLYRKSLIVAPSPLSPAPAPAPVVSPQPPASMLPGGGQPAPSPAAAVFLHLKASPAPGAAPAPMPALAPAMAPAAAVAQEPMPLIFVTFTAGPRMGQSARGLGVTITFVDAPNNGIDDVAAAKPFLEYCLKNGLFEDQIEDGLMEVTNIEPSIRSVGMETKKIDQWNINKCEKHMRSIVKGFTRYYTRRQVPVALYNECTNFMTRMSFSHDHVLDAMDTKRCRRATRKFSKHWNYGDNAEEKDFEEMCFHACEAKYGRNAPTCNLHAGDKIIGQPLL